MIACFPHLLAASLIAAALWPTNVLAQQMGSPHQGAQEASRGAEITGTAKPHGASPIPPRRADATRSAWTADIGALTAGYAAVSRSRDGKETTMPAGDALKKAVEASLAAASGDKAAGAERKAVDPAGGDDASREVFGADDRVQIKGTTAYPFRTIGYLEVKYSDGTYGSCSAALIGPRTVLTAAQCLYNYEAGAWFDEFVYFPGLASFEDAPYGGFAYDTVTIPRGFMENYKTSYSDVMPFDLGVMTLQEPIGDSLGWLGFANFNDLGDFTANLVGYPTDKPGGSMWRATCDVISENIQQDIFTYKCDTTPGTGGGSVYTYNESTKERTVLGVDVAADAGQNYAVRLNAANVEWINSLWK